MTQLEKDLLLSLKDALLESTKVEWERGLYGTLDEWSDWAKRMKNNIKTSCVILDAMIKQPAKVEEE